MIIYRHIRLDKNEPFYIGATKSDKRPFSKDQRNKEWHKVINITDYEVEILFDDLTIEEAFEKEKEFIKFYGRIDLGTGTLVNMTDGGIGMKNYLVSNETKLKKSESMKGKTFTEEHKKNIGESSKNRYNSEETKYKKGSFNRGKKFSDETRKRISEGRLGKKYPRNK